MSGLHTYVLRTPNKPLLPSIAICVAVWSFALNENVCAASDHHISKVQGTKSTTIEVAQLEAPLSAAKLKKIYDALAIHGHDIDIEPIIANSLGLTETHLRQLPVRDNASGHIHIFYTVPSGGFLLTYMNNTVANTYRLDSGFHLVASVAMSNHVPGQVSDAEAGANAELSYWSHLANHL